MQAWGHCGFRSFIPEWPHVALNCCRLEPGRFNFRWQAWKRRDRETVRAADLQNEKASGWSESTLHDGRDASHKSSNKITFIDPRTVARKSSIGRLYVRARVGWHSNLTKIPLIYSVSYFSLGGLELCLGGLSPPKPPSGDGTVDTVRSCIPFFCSWRYTRADAKFLAALVTWCWIVSFSVKSVVDSTDNNHFTIQCSIKSWPVVIRDIPFLGFQG